MKKEFKEYLKHLKSKNDELNPEDYLFKSQKLGKPYNRVSISRLFANIYKKFNIHGASHFGRHLFVSKLVNSGVNICLVQRLANHRNISTTQRYFNYNPQMLSNAVESLKIWCLDFVILNFPNKDLYPIGFWGGGIHLSN